MEVTPGAEIPDGRYNLLKVNVGKLSSVTVIYCLPYHFLSLESK